MARLSPGSSGELTDPQGKQWVARRHRLDPRTVQSMLKRPDIAVLLGESGGFELRWLTTEADRQLLLERVRRCYALPLNSSACEITYLGHEFIDAEACRLLYVEEHC